jgi:hypothetical protein
MKRRRISPFDILKFNVRIASNIETRINNIQKDGAFVMDLTKKEKNALVGILKTEMIEVKDLIADEEMDKKDTNELKRYLTTIEGIFNKLN